MRKAFYSLVISIALVIVAAAQLPEVKPAGVNGPWVVSLADKGSFSKSTDYTVNDLVTHDGRHYVSMAAGNKGNIPLPSSTYWLILPESTSTPTTAGWGTANGADVSFGDRHFRTSDSYTCGALADMTAPPPQPTPPPPQEPPVGGGRPIRPPRKTHFTNKSGSEFVIDEATVAFPLGYVCAGN